MAIELTSSEHNRQLTLLKKLRYRHHARLGATGIAQRAFDEPIPINFIRNVDQFTESTLLFPLRKKLGDVPIGRLWGGSASYSVSCNALPQNIHDWLAFLRMFPDADVLKVGRHDAAHRGGWQRSIIDVGVQLDRADKDRGILPLDGIAREDAVAVSGLILEVETLRQANRLTALNADTLQNEDLTINHGPYPLP
jgi:hypothetical protein